MNDPSSVVPTIRSPEDRWRSTLDDLEVALDRQRHALDVGDHADAAAIAALVFRPPDDLPPLPSSFEERAERLLARTSALIEETQTIATGLRPAGVVVHQPPARRAAATFDQRM